MGGRNSIEALTEAIGRYNDAWNAQDLDAIVAMHAPDMVFANHTAGESAQGGEVRGHIATIFDSWPGMTLRDAAALCPRGRRHAGVDRHRDALQDAAPRRHRGAPLRQPGELGRRST